MKSKLLDVFLFYNELDLLKTRLEYLGPIVDNFIISEANLDFSGKSKEFVLSQELINKLPFSEKIIYHREFLNLNSINWIFKKLKYRKRKNSFLWKIQDAQRNSTLIPLKNFAADDVVIFSDLDEFPSSIALKEGISYLQDEIFEKQLSIAYSCDQTFYYYNLNNAAPNEKFYGSVITNLETFRSLLPHKIRSEKNDFKHLSDGGWHFSYFMDEQKILNKIQAIGDVENLAAYKKISVSDIQKKMSSGSDLYDRGTHLSNRERDKIPSSLIKILERHLPKCT